MITGAGVAVAQSSQEDTTVVWTQVATDVPFEHTTYMVRLDADGCLYHFHNDAARSQRNHKSCNGGQTWTALPSYPSPSRSDFAVCTSNGRIFLIAGSTDGSGRGFTSSVISSSDGVNWSAEPNFPDARGFHNCATDPTTDNIYVAAGCCSYKSDVKAFTGNAWITTTSSVSSTLYKSRAYSAMAALDNGDLFISGGHEFGPYVNAIDLWRSTNDGVSWSRLCNGATCPWNASMLSSHLTALFGMGDRLFVGFFEHLYVSHDRGVSFTQVTQQPFLPVSHWNARHPAVDAATDSIFVVSGSNMYVGTLGAAQTTTTTTSTTTTGLPSIAANAFAEGDAWMDFADTACGVGRITLTQEQVLAGNTFAAGTPALVLWAAGNRVIVEAPAVDINATALTRVDDDDGADAVVVGRYRLHTTNTTATRDDVGDGSVADALALEVRAPLLVLSGADDIGDVDVRITQSPSCTRPHIGCDDDRNLLICSPFHVALRGLIVTLATNSTP
ncbi:hypothetical protein PTSG_06345 [Salpingoeca rosetta]|uniref:DUF6242 domain-containing protein n=1 Tax=Salpingoeca rosetta (strain ATCC 50818 / BSB-021) TaxID=946362 RepID=F2UCM8_SALR5|nr:uncharacterized protein PTSG_06345 [Salpingoeca rosetta]EGD74335.1 hypothetical protein PTSG_06345 [Salpingoeca rosetta]|eukprot:XP_004993235.1 hypothetical protein PTSG_06345 [Salpingoeca rosetta]